VRIVVVNADVFLVGSVVVMLMVGVIVVDHAIVVVVEVRSNSSITTISEEIIRRKDQNIQHDVCNIQEEISLPEDLKIQLKTSKQLPKHLRNTEKGIFITGVELQF